MLYNSIATECKYLMYECVFAYIYVYIYDLVTLGALEYARDFGMAFFNEYYDIAEESMTERCQKVKRQRRGNTHK